MAVGYEVGIEPAMDVALAEWRTRLTSRVASGDQRSTVRTKYEISISLFLDVSPAGLRCLGRLAVHAAAAAGTLKNKISRDFVTPHLTSTSLLVAESLTINLTHGGGVIGRRSCRRSHHRMSDRADNGQRSKSSTLSLSPCPQNHTSAPVSVAVRHRDCTRNEVSLGCSALAYVNRGVDMPVDATIVKRGRRRRPDLG